MFTYLGKPVIRVSELKKCFYCGGSLPAKNKEHIFNSCWGGSHKTSHLICDSCNKEFSKIDSAFSEYTKFVMNAHAFKGERHKEVPEIVTEGDYNIEAYAKPKPKKQQVIKALPDGSIEVSLFCSKKQAYEWLDSDKPEADLERSLTEDERQDLRQGIAEGKKQPINVGPQKISVTLNLRQQYRSAAHTLLKCLGFYTPAWVCNDVTSEVREFARYDKGGWQKFAVLVEQHTSYAENAAYKLGVRYNAAEIYWCRSLEKVIGIVTILGRVQRAVIIAEGYQGPDATLSVIEDTYGSKHLHPFFVEFNSEMPPLPLLDILHYPPTIESFQQELSRLLSASFSFEGLTASLGDGIEKIIKQTPEVTESTLQKYENLFLDYASNLKKDFGISVELAEVSSKLSANGFLYLAQHYMGRSCKEPEVLSILDMALDKTFKYLSNYLTTTNE